jgi:hypothetical protein
MNGGVVVGRLLRTCPALALASIMAGELAGDLIRSSIPTTVQCSATSPAGASRPSPQPDVPCIPETTPRSPQQLTADPQCLPCQCGDCGLSVWLGRAAVVTLAIARDDVELDYLVEENFASTISSWAEMGVG